MKKPTMRYVIAVAVVSGLLITAALIIKTVSRQGTPESVIRTQQEIAGLYRGKMIRIVVPSAPGGGFDAYSRLLAPYLEKYTGASVRIDNLPGAGGLRAVNELYNSPPDGMTLSIIGGSSMITTKLAGIKGAYYEVEKFAYLGRVMADTRVLLITRDSGVNIFEDLLHTRKTIKLGATGLGGSGYVDGVISKEAFGLDVQVIHGFDTLANVILAMNRNDLHGAWAPWSSIRDIVLKGTEQVILQSGLQRNPDLPDVPTIFELIDQTENPERARAIITAWDALNSVGGPIATSPGTPEDRLQFLREAFRQSMYDPDFIQTAEKAKLPIQYASAEAIMEIIKDAIDLEPEIETLFIRVVKGEI